MNAQTSKPLSIAIIGWSSVLAAGIMILMDIGNLMTSAFYDTLSLNLPGLSQYIPESAKRILDLYRYSQWWNIYGIVYFIFVLVAGIQFLRLRAWGRQALEVACWVGLLNAVIDTWLSYVIWQSMQEMISSVLQGMSGGKYSYLSPLGSTAITAGFFLWIVPCIGMIVFLRRPKVKELVSVKGSL